jgi:hypothetical protein
MAADTPDTHASQKEKVRPRRGSEDRDGPLRLTANLRDRSQRSQREAKDLMFVVYLTAFVGAALFALLPLLNSPEVTARLGSLSRSLTVLQQRVDAATTAAKQNLDVMQSRTSSRAGEHAEIEGVIDALQYELAIRFLKAMDDVTQKCRTAEVSPDCDQAEMQLVKARDSFAELLSQSPLNPVVQATVFVRAIEKQAKEMTKHHSLLEQLKRDIPGYLQSIQQQADAINSQPEVLTHADTTDAVTNSVARVTIAVLLIFVIQFIMVRVRQLVRISSVCDTRADLLELHGMGAKDSLALLHPAFAAPDSGDETLANPLESWRTAIAAVVAKEQKDPSK